MKLVTWFAAALMCLGLASPALAGDCEQAGELVRQALEAKDDAAKKTLLSRAVELCPGDALAWNNLAAARELSGELEGAEAAYNSSLEAEPAFAPPLAGLGDVSLARGDFGRAKEYYGRFLTVLDREEANGDPLGLVRYRTEYRLKRARAGEKMSVQRSSMDSVVPKALLIRALSPTEGGEDFAKPVGPERVALASVLFEFNSAAIKPRGLEQLAEMAKAMLSPELAGARFVVAGHTDSHGEAVYNLDLSQRRAAGVRAFLISQGVPADRLEVTGYGETRLIVARGTKKDQAINRRVEFVNLGPAVPAAGQTAD